MFLARRLNSGIPYQISASGVNMAMSMTLGLITYSNALSATATGLCRTEAETTELKPKRAEAMLDEKRMFVATRNEELKETREARTYERKRSSTRLPTSKTLNASSHN